MTTIVVVRRQRVKTFRFSQVTLLGLRPDLWQKQRTHALVSTHSAHSSHEVKPALHSISISASGPGNNRAEV